MRRRCAVPLAELQRARARGGAVGPSSSSSSFSSSSCVSLWGRYRQPACAPSASTRVGGQPWPSSTSSTSSSSSSRSRFLATGRGWSARGAPPPRAPPPAAAEGGGGGEAIATGPDWEGRWRAARLKRRQGQAGPAASPNDQAKGNAKGMGPAAAAAGSSSSDPEAKVLAFAGRVGLEVKDAALYLRAFTHASAEPVGGYNNTKLEFLGDRVLNFVVCDHLSRQYPNLPAGALIDATLLFCNNSTLFEVGKKLGIGDVVRYTHSAQDMEDRAYRTITADAVEALLAAIYTEHGMEGARKFVVQHVVPPDCDIIPFLRQKLPKKTLFDLLQRRGSGTPYYQVLQESGRLSHKSTFLVGVFSDGNLLAQGNGASIALAEANAAQEAINKLWGESAHLRLPETEYNSLE